MTYKFYVNDEERMPTPEEKRILTDRFMAFFGGVRMTEEQKMELERKKTEKV